MIDPFQSLREALQAARHRRDAASRALAPKHKGGEWEEFHAAVEAELVAERALAAAQDEPYAVPIEFPALWDVGAPMPHLLQSEHRTFLVFLAKDLDTRQFAVVEFKHCISTLMGTPNDEVLEGHPLHGKGLQAYRPMRVEHSRWLAELERINSVHDQYTPERWRKLSHYLFGFHDSTFECVAESVVVELQQGSLPEVLAEVCKRLVE